MPSFSEEENSNLINLLKAYSVNCIVIKANDNDYDAFYEMALKEELVN